MTEHLEAPAARALASAAQEQSQVPVDVWHWVLALLPIVVLLLLYVWRQWKGPEAAPIGLLVAAVIAVLAFQMPLQDLGVAVGKGVWDALPIVLLILFALLLYRVVDAAGAFVALRRGVERVTENRVFLVLSFGWVFTSFIQGIVGFGTPLVIAAPIMLALGVKPIYAIAIPLIGHSWANFFGTLGVGWTATTQVVQLEDETSTAVLTAALLIPAIFCVGVGIAWMIGKWQAVKHAMPFILIQTAVLGGVQLLVVLFSPTFSTLVAGAAGLAAVLWLTRWKRYREPFELEESPALEEQEEGEDEPEPVMNLWMALAPYGILTVLGVVVLGIPAVTSFAERLQLALPFPATETGYGVSAEATDAYEPYTPFADASGLVAVSVVLAWALYASLGYYRKWRERAEPEPVLRSAFADGAPAITAIVIFLVLASLYTASGLLEMLARGIGNVAPPPVYAFLTPVIGVIGALVTSSSTSSNVLFSPLQDAVAGQLGLSQSAVIAGQSVGGALGNVVAPVNLTVGLSAVGAGGELGRLMRMMAVWLAPVIVISGLIAIPLALVLGGA